MKRPSYVFAVLTLVSAVGGYAGCVAGGSDPVDCAKVTVKPYSEINSAFAYCTSCHGGNRAASGYRYDNYDDAASGANAAADAIANGSMPPNQDMPTDLADAVNVWAQCGTPQ